MTDAQVRFVAGHVDSTQKVSRQTAERLRAGGVCSSFRCAGESSFRPTADLC